MERVFLKLESEGLMTKATNKTKDIYRDELFHQKIDDPNLEILKAFTVDKSIKKVAVNKLNDFEQIKSLIDEAILTEDKSNSVRSTLLFKCAMASLNPKYKIHKCAIVKRAITRKEFLERKKIASVINPDSYILYEMRNFQ